MGQEKPGPAAASGVRRWRVRDPARLLAEEVRVELPAVVLISHGKVGSPVIYDWPGGTSPTDLFIYGSNEREELQETLTELDDQAVVDYLIKKITGFYP